MVLKYTYGNPLSPVSFPHPTLGATIHTNQAGKPRSVEQAREALWKSFITCLRDDIVKDFIDPTRGKREFVNAPGIGNLNQLTNAYFGHDAAVEAGLTD